MLEELITYFEGIPSAHRSLILAGGLSLFWLIEIVLPLHQWAYNKGRHAAVNLFFTMTTAVVNFGFAFLIVKASDYSIAQSWGVLGLLDLPLWLELIIGLMILDLVGAYFVHWLEHKLPWMWRFHIIHHSDSKVDVTTALRHHPGESVFRALFTLLAVLIAGAPMWLVMLYQSLSAFMSQFNHALIKLPAMIDRGLSLFLVTPRVHRVHHHALLPYTDSNYGNIFSLWDRFFGTMQSLEADKIEYGLDVFDKREGNLGDLLGLPFDGRKYKVEQDT